MASTLIGAAVGTVAANLPHGAQGVTAAEGNLAGRKVTHWSVWIVAGGAVVGAIIAVAGVILALADMPVMYAVAAIGGLMFVTNAFGAFFVWHFSNRCSEMGDMKDYTERQGAQAKALEDTTAKLRATEARVEALNSDFQRTGEEYTATTDKLQKEVGAKVEELKMEIRNREAAEAKLKKLGDTLVKELDQQNDKYAQIVSNVSAGNDQLDEKITLLGEKTRELKEINSMIADKILVLDEEKGEFLALRAEFAKQGEMLDGLNDLLAEHSKQLATGTQELDQENDELEVTIENIVKERQKLEETKKELGEMVQEMKKATAKAGSLNDLKKRYAALEAENMKLKEKSKKPHGGHHDRANKP